MLDPNHDYFPDPADHPAFAVSFLRMMFAHAKFEMRIGDLTKVILSKDQLGRKETWNARERPKEIAKLIRKHRGEIPEIAMAEKCLQDAVEACDQRNHLAHGIWWRFANEVITVAAVIKRPEEEKHVDFSRQDIENLADRFDDLEVTLWKVQRTLEGRSAIT